MAQLRILLPLLLCLVWRPGACAQGGNADAHSREGDRHFQRMAYAAAIGEYRLAADLGAVNQHVTKRLAECYMKLGDTENAEVWYAQVVKFLNREPIDIYRYAQALKGNAKYQEAEEWMDRYLAIVGPAGGQAHSNITQFAEKFTFSMDRFTVRLLPISSPFSDMAPTWCGPDRVIFSSSRKQSYGIRRTAAWNGQPFLDLYVAQRLPNGDLLDPQPLAGDVNGPLHEGPAVCDATGSELWYTRNNPSRGSSGVRSLSILRARRVGDGFSGADPFPLNSTETSVGHPALSTDGKALYFTSDMPGGLGGTDIYVCLRVGAGWGEPVNLGPGVNTPFDEGFPFIAQDGTLYFASDGQPGLGGLDIFASPRTEDGGHVVAINLGVPVNGPKDDFGLIIDAAGKSGYFTSNRPGGRGDDDIYAFTMHQPLEQRYLCTGTVIDDETGQPVSEVEVELLDKQQRVLGTKQTDVKGKYSFVVDRDQEYTVRARMKGRFDGEQHLSTETIEQQQIVARDIHLVPDAGIWMRGAVRHKEKLGFIEGMNVSVVNLGSFATEQKLTGPGGDFSFRMQANEEFEVLFEKPGFFSLSLPVRTTGMARGVIDLNEAADLSFEEIQVGKPIPLKHQRWIDTRMDLDPVARTELDVLADRLQVNPAVHVEVAVHSDARGDLAEALKLSQKRADVIGAYLRSKGVPKEHLVVKGYGAMRLLNHCAPGVNCTDAEHAQNRRVEWTVTSVDSR